MQAGFRLDIDKAKAKIDRNDDLQMELEQSEWQRLAYPKLVTKLND